MEDIFKELNGCIKKLEKAIEEAGLFAHTETNILERKLKDWEKNGIRSKLTGLIVAPEDVDFRINQFGHEHDGKYYFTYNEAIGLEKHLPDGWRLPTRSEWVLLCEEFGNDEDGELSADRLVEKLNLKVNGYCSDDMCYGKGSYGRYWSKSIGYATYGYNLYFNTFGNVSPQDYSNKRYGFSVRLVKKVE